MKTYIFKLLIILFIYLPWGKVAAQSSIVITEIFYNQPGNDTLEFVELLNIGNEPLNLKGYRFTNGIAFTFPDQVISPGNYLIVAKSSAAITSFFKVTSLQWDANSSLDNSGERLTLTDAAGNLIDEVVYDNNLPWDSAADGKGPSLILCNPNTDNSIANRWSASKTNAGNFSGNIIYASPGELNGECTDNLAPEIVKSISANINTIKIIFSEPVNSSAENKSNYAGLPSDYTISLNTTRQEVNLQLAEPLQVGMYYTFTVKGISDEKGNTMQQEETEKVIFNDTEGDIIITEIMYNDPTENDTLEFIEIYNKGNVPVNYGGYKFDKGISFEFPEGSLEPQKFWIIAANPAFVNDFFNISNSLQWKNSNLSNSGERLAIINTAGKIIDSTTYGLSTLSNGNGYSAELCADYNSWGVSGSKFKSLNGKDIYASPGNINNCISSTKSPAEIEALVTVCPNPSSGIFQIIFTENKSNYYTVELVDLTGRSFFKEIATEPTLNMDLSQYNLKGMYSLTIKDLTNNTTIAKKILFN